MCFTQSLFLEVCLHDSFYCEEVDPVEVSPPADIIENWDGRRSFDLLQLPHWKDVR